MRDAHATYRAACDRWSAAAPGTAEQAAAWTAMIRALLDLGPLEFGRLQDAAQAEHARRVRRGA